MSAWIVSKEHIDVLVKAMLDNEVIELPDASLVGRKLWAENHRSINHRYSETRRTPGYSYTAPDDELAPIALYKQVACYEYQTCEHPTWGASEAHELCSQLCDALTKKAGMQREDVRSTQEWRDAPWGV